jgi:transposase
VWGRLEFRGWLVNDVGVCADSRPSYEELTALVGVLSARLEGLEQQFRVVLAVKDADIAELRAENAELRAENAELRAENAELRAENAELRRRLGMDSTNSSKPPSSDSPFTKPAPKSLRGKTGRKPGGQPGHRGQTLELVTDPDEVIVHEPAACSGCGGGLAGAAAAGVTRRQVFDLPPVKVQVCEHRFIARRCGCGTVTCADAPPNVTARVQYGPRVQAIVLYLHAGQFLSKQRATHAVSELFGTPLSPGTVSAITSRAGQALGGFTEAVRARLQAAPVAGFDETGLRVAGKLHWVHVSRTETDTLITCHSGRGKDGIDDNGVLAGFTGVAVHDAWAPYDTYSTVAGHQLCCAHVLRELQAVVDTVGTDVNGWCWAAQACDAINSIWKLAGHGDIDAGALAEQVHLYRSAASIGLRDNVSRGSDLQRKHHALARRLLDRQADYLRFTTNTEIPPDNNGSERDIRMIKIRQKISGCLRTLTGAQHFCALRSYISTAAKHGHGMLQALVELTEGRPWLPTVG